jgi:hypothetical protein
MSRTKTRQALSILAGLAAVVPASEPRRSCHRRAGRPRRLGRAVIGAVACVAGLLACGAVPASAQVLRQGQGPTNAAVYHGRAVWSQYDPATGDVHLATSLDGGPAELLAIGPRRTQFDVDLGPDAAGNPVAVYSRCRHEPPFEDALSGLLFIPEWAGGRGCDVYRYDFATHREHRIRGASDPAVSEFLPSVWRDHLVFATVDPRRRGRPRLSLIDLDHPSRVSHVPGGSAGDDAAPIAIDLRGSHVAFTWELSGVKCSLTYGSERNVDDPATTELWLGAIGRREVRTRRLARGCEWERRAFLQGPSFSNAGLSYIDAGPGISPDLPRRLVTRPLGRGATRRMTLPGCVVSAIRDGGFLYTARETTCPAPDPLTPSDYEVTRSPDSQRPGR